MHHNQRSSLCRSKQHIIFLTRSLRTTVCCAVSNGLQVIDYNFMASLTSWFGKYTGDYKRHAAGAEKEMAAAAKGKAAAVAGH